MLRFAWEKRLRDCGGSITVDGTSSLFIPAKEVPLQTLGRMFPVRRDGNENQVVLRPWPMPREGAPNSLCPGHFWSRLLHPTSYRSPRCFCSRQLLLSCTEKNSFSSMWNNLTGNLWSAWSSFWARQMQELTQLKKKKKTDNTVHHSVSVAAFKTCCRKMGFWNRKVHVELLCIQEHVL